MASRYRLPRLGARVLLALSAALAVTLLPGIPAQAQPTAAQLEAQINDKWHELEPIIEQYNKVRVELKANEKKAAELDKKIQPLMLQTEMATERIGLLATRQYKGGPSLSLNALLTVGTPDSLADQMTMLRMLARHEQRQVAGVVTVKEQYETEKMTLETVITEQRKQDADLAAKKKKIDTEIKNLERLQAQMNIPIGPPVRIGTCPTNHPNRAVATACAQIGKPYVWGAAGPNSFDCSGLTQYAWARAGVSLPHYTGAQWNRGTAVSRADAKAGDLVFFGSDLSHVGIYLGNGVTVHAPRAGLPVQMASIDQMGKPVVGFRRVGTG
ncbi:NlpC/P60 family protein [Polymorphospora sp. NPDC051019]|uniref:C40 family peptidase n=1 Tax=Polymorphospora sp. NPDC051019 TaxID=3155725 RepID=UPI00341CB2D9